MKLDDFEAVFRSSVKSRFKLEAPPLGSIMVLTDLPAGEAAALETRVQEFLAQSFSGAPGEYLRPSWRTVRDGEYGRVSEMIALISDESPDLIVSYRHLLGRDKDLLHSLGSFIDTATQATDIPVLLLPPLSHPDFDRRMKTMDTVLVATDHIASDQALVNWGVSICPNHGTVVLAHIESESVFKRYGEIIAMIPDADTETTLARIRKKLLGRPRDYIDSIIAELRAAEIDEKVVPVVEMGDTLSDYKRIIDEHDVDLIVMGTKDNNQLAMRGMAYAMAIELQDRPMLLL
ncbi:MAG: universal stress protein [Myxococcota bacterium]